MPLSARAEFIPLYFLPNLQNYVNNAIIVVQKLLLKASKRTNCSINKKEEKNRF